MTGGEYRGDDFESDLSPESRLGTVIETARLGYSLYHNLGWIAFDAFIDSVKKSGLRFTAPPDLRMLVTSSHKQDRPDTDNLYIYAWSVPDEWPRSFAPPIRSAQFYATQLIVDHRTRRSWFVDAGAEYCTEFDLRKDVVLSREV